MVVVVDEEEKAEEEEEEEEYLDKHQKDTTDPYSADRICCRTRPERSVELPNLTPRCVREM